MSPATKNDLTDKQRKEQERRERAKQLGSVILVSQLGLTMVGSILLGLLIGFYLDKWLDTKPVFIIIFILLGVVGGGYQAYRQIMETVQPNEKDELRKK